MVGVSSRGLAVGKIGLAEIYHLPVDGRADERIPGFLQIEKRKEKKRKEMNMETKHR